MNTPFQTNDPGDPYSRETWRDQAACLDTDPELWFPVWPTSRMTLNRARAICSGCEVRQACLQYARDRPEPVGLWGGTVGSQRVQLRAAARQRAAS